MRKLLIGAAAIALAASGAHAEQGKGGGGGNGGDHGNGAEHGGKGGGGEDRGGGTGRGDGGGEHGGPKAERARAEIGPAADKGPDRGDRAGPGNAGKGPGSKNAERGNDRGNPGVARDNPPFRWSGAHRTGLVNGCPPGLAKKNNGCMPPGLARKDDRLSPWRSYFQRPDWWGLRGIGDGRYDYSDGYLVRYSGNSIASYIPLLGGALSVGSLWPSSYEPVGLPSYYQDFYTLGPSYRYADDVLYRVDPQTSAIESIAALLTGNDLSVGSPLPAGYDVYNVPYAYRDRYVDGSDAMYRYSDGYVYQVDPTTRLVQAAIQLLL